MIDRVFPEGYKVVAVHQVRLPTFVLTSKKVRKALNLNVYRNLHYHSLNNQKQNFHEEVKKLLGKIPRANKVWVHYQIFAPTNGRLDTMNVGSIVDKYFSDTLVEAKVIPDDNYEHMVFNSFCFGGVRKMDGHAIATIYILEEEKPMRVLLDQNDIQEALESFVKTMGLEGASGVKLSVNGDDIEAEVTFGETTPEVEQPNPKRKYTRRKKAEKPVEEEVKDEPTETTGEGSSDSVDRTEGQGTEKSSPDGEEEPKKTGKSGSKKTNLFGDEENQSSESDEKASEASETSQTGSAKPKRMSIFDAD